jgi:hypothetical protein
MLAEACRLVAIVSSAPRPCISDVSTDGGRFLQCGRKFESSRTDESRAVTVAVTVRSAFYQANHLFTTDLRIQKMISSRGCRTLDGTFQTFVYFQHDMGTEGAQVNGC